MLSPARWLFTVGNPHDAKLRGWLHPICATFFNACLAFCIAFAVFLLSPLPNTEEWQQQQPQFVRSTVSAVQRQSHELMVLTGLTSEGIDAVKGIVRGIFLPELTLHDKEQAFALYNWNVDGGNAHVDGTPKLGSMHSALLLLYVVVLCGCRVWEKGPWIIYEMSWACNIAMCLASADQILWYVDLISYALRRKFLVGVMKYILDPQTSLAKIATSFHHLWFIPYLTYINTKCCTPFQIWIPSTQKSSTVSIAAEDKTFPKSEKTRTSIRSDAKKSDNSRKPKDSEDTEKCGYMQVLNVNVAWKCWADVTKHIPFLAICDDKPAIVFVLWNQLIWGTGNCVLFGLFLSVTNRFM